MLPPMLPTRPFVKQLISFAANVNGQQLITVSIRVHHNQLYFHNQRIMVVHKPTMASGDGV